MISYKENGITNSIFWIWQTFIGTINNWNISEWTLFEAGFHVKVKVAQLCLTLCDPMEYKVHGILQSRILEWVAFPFSTGFPQPRDWTQVSCIAGGLFTSWAIGEAQEYWSGYPFSGGSSWPRNWTGVPYTAGGFFTYCAIRDAHIVSKAAFNWNQNILTQM